MLTAPPSTHSSPLLSGAFATEQREKLLDRPLSARFDLLGPGHRQHPEQPTHLLVADGQPDEGIDRRLRLFEVEVSSLPLPFEVAHQLRNDAASALSGEDLSESGIRGHLRDGGPVYHHGALAEQQALQLQREAAQNFAGIAAPLEVRRDHGVYALGLPPDQLSSNSSLLFPNRE